MKAFFDKERLNRLTSLNSLKNRCGKMKEEIENKEVGSKKK